MISALGQEATDTAGDLVLKAMLHEYSGKIPGVSQKTFQCCLNLN